MALPLAPTACGDDEAAATSATPSDATRSDDRPTDDWTERLAEPDVETVLAALAQPHATVREALGPHRMRVTTALSLVHADGDDEGDTEAPPPPPLDGPVVESQRIEDTLQLVWAPAPDGTPQLSLSQSNDHDRGREVVLVDETMHVRHAHRRWVHYPRDSDLFEQWLDDAQRSVHDAVELAAPRLAIEAATIEGGGHDGAAVEITLALAESTVRERVARGPTQAWRTAAEIEAVTGSVRLDARRGAWLSATVDVGYRLTGADGRPLTGHLHLEASVEPDPAATVQAPADSAPMPRRLRYDEEQRRLLDGLAVP